MADSDGGVIDTAAAVNGAVAAAQSRMGLQQPRQSASATGAGVRNKRRAQPLREGPIWNSVTVTREHDTTPQVQCKNCDKAPFCAGSTRIEDHILNVCTCETDAFLAMKEKLMAEKEKKDDLKKQKVAVKEANAASDVKPEEKLMHPKLFGGQTSIKTSMNAASKVEVDDVIAECFYALNITPHVADSPWFKRM
eukprot:419800-Prymnesium_polylepis.1